MQYSLVAAAILALTTSVFGQTPGFVPITAPTQDQNVAAGSTLEIVWQPTPARPGPITIQLLQGATPATLEVGATIASSIDQTTGKFSWTVPKDLKSFATYGFKITLDSTKTLPATEQVFQFSFPFHVTGLGAASSSAASGYPTGGTTTVHLSTGTGYTAKPTTSSVSSVVSSYVVSAPVNSTSTLTHGPATTPSVAIGYPTGNVTLSTSAKPTASVSKPASGSGSATATAPATTVTGNSASTIARGGLAVAAGMVFAFAL
ncbi:hypothetical protein VTL71DRAFT_4043 [Oculimacula yallundae]|uniref:Yeast cell wall synthesis Kre9/Knh1-like N-terminal domain-containing protein n=1 Tax=Oculimacula yallundae TaxID=86028 RepID=A0ABR4C4P5_9HELO